MWLGPFHWLWCHWAAQVTWKEPMKMELCTLWLWWTSRGLRVFKHSQPFPSSHRGGGRRGNGMGMKEPIRGVLPNSWLLWSNHCDHKCKCCLFFLYTVGPKLSQHRKKGSNMELIYVYTGFNVNLICSLPSCSKFLFYGCKSINGFIAVTEHVLKVLNHSE